MPKEDLFEFEPLADEKVKDDDLFSLDDFSSAPEITEKQISLEKENSFPDDEKIHLKQPKRTSANFEPDMEMILITAQSSMIIEAMKLFSQHDFKSKNTSIFAEAVKGIDLYIKLLQRNPENFHKIMSMLSVDPDCMDVQKISFNLYKNIYGEFPDSDSQRLKSFEILRDKVQTGYYKSLISSSLINIKKFYLLTGSLDSIKINQMLTSNPDILKKEIDCYSRHIAIARELIKSGDYEINKGMKGREINVFIIKASQLLSYYFSKIGDTERSNIYQRLNDNFRKYFIMK